MIKQYCCYIEEYNNGQCARLRDKKTNIKISFASNDKSDKCGLLIFLSSAKIIALDIYSQNCDDSVFISGDCVSEGGDEIVIASDENLTYYFQ